MTTLRLRLQSLLSQRLTYNTWGLACRLIEASWREHPDRFDDAALAALTDDLSVFPDDLRRAPVSWQRLGDRPWTCPLYALTSGVLLGARDEYAGVDVSFDDADLPALLAAPWLPRMRHLGLFSGCKLSEAGLQRLLHDDALLGLTSLSFCFQPSPFTAQLEALLAAPGMDGLRSLAFHGAAAGPDAGLSALRRLLTSPTGRRLSALGLSSNQRHELLDALIEAPLPSLTALDVGFSSLPTATLRALLTAATLPALTALTARHGKLEPDAASAFEAASLTTLRRLDLHHCDAGAAVGLAIAQRPAFSRLTHLQAGHNSFGDEVALALASSGCRETLTALDLSQQPLGDDGLIALVDASGFEHLTALSLALNSSLSAYGFQALGARRFPALKSLDVHGISAGDLGVRDLTSGAIMEGLEALNISSCRGRGDGLASLAACGRGGALRRLDVSLNGGDDAQVGALLNTDALPALRHLNLSRARFTDAGIFESAAGLPSLRSLTLTGLGRRQSAVAGAIVRNPRLQPALRVSWMAHAPVGALKAAAKPLKLKGLSKLKKPALIDALAGAL